MRVLGVLAGLSLAMAAGGAAADTVILQQAGSSALVDTGPVALPGPGTYRFEVSTSTPVDFEITAGYRYHWDVFVAPPPKPHSEFIEGNTADISDGLFGHGQAAVWAFTVPETVYTFFSAPEFYELFGVPEGTPVYKEERSEEPFYGFYLAGESSEGPAFDYSFSITQLSATPEPATWATMILGFGLAGAALRMRRRAVLR
jgi:hypothetical protein